MEIWASQSFGTLWTCSRPVMGLLYYAVLYTHLIDHKFSKYKLGHNSTYAGISESNYCVGQDGECLYTKYVSVCERFTQNRPTACRYLPPVQNSEAWISTKFYITRSLKH